MMSKLSANQVLGKMVKGASDASGSGGSDSSTTNSTNSTFVDGLYESISLRFVYTRHIHIK